MCSDPVECDSERSPVTIMLCSQRARRTFTVPHGVWRWTQILTRTCTKPSKKDWFNVRIAVSKSGEASA
eukprot:scaffold62004_cov30-Tisochrysis_lutea.AAC.3